MGGERVDDLRFQSDADYLLWLKSEEWYQTIQLGNGFKTSGKQRTDQRIAHFANIDFRGKSVLDVGCNSGQYSLFAKKQGASKVVGIDINAMRINQARVLSANENLPIDFRVAGIDCLGELGKFDIVFCIAVLTEIEDVLGGLRLIRNAIFEKGFIEMGLSKPCFYLSRNRRWWRGDKQVSRRGRIGEFVRHQHAGWVFYPSLEIVRDVFSPDFEVNYGGAGLRYDMVYIRKSLSK